MKIASHQLPLKAAQTLDSRVDKFSRHGKCRYGEVVESAGNPLPIDGILSNRSNPPILTSYIDVEGGLIVDEARDRNRPLRWSRSGRCCGNEGSEL